MFMWILIIVGVVLIIGLASISLGMAPKGVDPEDVRNIKRNNSGKGDYFGGASM
ncbi:hypothetical protein ACWZJV_02270 [Nocardioides sp. WG-D5]|nr:hypothetical protein NBCG_01257 [Nocardioidaceae bacterium Broad-1]MBG6096152.1 hypothetical protein [Nocardioides luteus]